MINILIWILIVLFGLKLLINLTFGFAMVEIYKDVDSPRTSMSLWPPIEIPIWILALILSLFSKKDQWYSSPLVLEIGGLITIVISYVIGYLVLLLCGMYIDKSGLSKAKEETIARLKKIKESSESLTPQIQQNLSQND